MRKNYVQNAIKSWKKVTIIIIKDVKNAETRKNSILMRKNNVKNAIKSLKKVIITNIKDV